jgi:SAM-dependent methyltransferase
VGVAHFLTKVTFQKKLQKTYRDRFLKYGATPTGSFWLSKIRQDKRFKLILDQIMLQSPRTNFSIADIGCGYGALAAYLSNDTRFRHVEYTGYDISPELITASQQQLTNSRFRFQVGTCPDHPTAFVVMSGTYNLAATQDLLAWERYLFDCLKACWNKTTRAMIFNLQVAKTAHIAKDAIYYAECENVIKLCNAVFGPTGVIFDPSLPNDATFTVRRPN